MDHYLCYQHNVQKFFIRHLEKFTGIIVPFSIASSFQSGTFGFLRALLAKDKSKKFALDPRSALFQHKWNRANVREPHRKLAAIFGNPFLSSGLDRPLTPDDFLNSENLSLSTNRCIQYQRKFRVLDEPERKLEKYRKLLGLDTMPEIVNPQRLIPPYFQFASLGDAWFDVSMRCIEHATTLVPADELTPVVHFSSWKGIEDWAVISDRLTAMGIKSVFVYPNNFKEHEAAESELQKYAECVAVLSKNQISADALHGGYFAILLEKKGLRGFGNGVGYGEWRNSAYHKGGTPEVRIYIPKLHRFLDPASAQPIITRGGEYFAAESDLLTGYALADKPLTQVQPQEALDHFMWCRQQEINFVASNTVKSLIADLHETVEVLKKVGPLEEETYGRPLSRWAATLSG